ncbi:hypothetical protein M2175_004017 [Bradyrhizobium elkanii]|uniref:hypothetical protein n=1 Tax=Bradyrhizobium TaxID=374 RepID=UPI002168FD04|nr:MULTISPECIES: hypothetical protein [Bradyrhizobium]MCS3928986.1 hypothetical protein [Bradyrhizobium elkanii]MCS3969542.1 hypothetical protein [Bradyrhizobium japonicum]
MSRFIPIPEWRGDAPPPRFPRLHPGDVVALLQPESFQFSTPSLHDRLLDTALAALAASAGVKYNDALSIKLEQWQSRAFELWACYGSRSLVLPPVAVATVERFLKLRPAAAAPHLFVRADGRPESDEHVAKRFARYAARCGYDGRNLPARLLEFFEDRFVGEQDRAAVAALAGRRVSPDCKHILSLEPILEALADRERLWRVLERNHLHLSGSADRLLGAAGRRLAADTRTIRGPVAKPPRVGGRYPWPPSLAMQTDPVVLEIAAALRLDGSLTERRRLRDLHLPHLDALRRDGQLRTGEIASLFDVDDTTVRLWTTKLMTPEERAALADWTKRLPKLYATRPHKETMSAFVERMARRGCRLHRLAIASLLYHGGALSTKPKGRR